MNNMHYIVHCIHTSHNFAMLCFSIVKYQGHLHIFLIFLNILVLHHLQSYLSPQLKPCLVFVWILLLKLQYMYFTFVHYISDTLNIQIQLHCRIKCTYNKEGFIGLLASEGIWHALNPIPLIFFWLLKLKCTL